MPWAAAIPAIISGVAGIAGGLLSNKGQSKSMSDQNAYMRWLLSPGRTNQSAAVLNPWLAQALGIPNQYGYGQMYGGAKVTDPFNGDLGRIVRGENLSPYLLNQPLNSINQGFNQNLAKFQSLVGRNGAQGGMANLYGLANLGQRNMAKANLYQQYGQWREQQRRSDLDWIMNMWRGAQGQAQGANQNLAQTYQQPGNSASMWGGALPFLAQAGTDIWKSLQKSQAPTPTSTIQTGAMNPYVNSLGSQGSWYGGWRG